MMDRLYGMSVHLDRNMVEPGDPVQVPRTWRERLLSRPWRPWVSTKTTVPLVPMERVLQTRAGFHMHPATWQRLQRELEQQAEQRERIADGR